MPSGRPRHRLCTLLLTLFSLPAFGPVGAAWAQGGPTGVAVDAVIVEPVSQTSAVLAQFVADSAVIAAQVNGVVEAVEVDVGDGVETGDVLARLGQGRLQAEFDLMEADFAEAEAALVLAEDTQSRLDDLRDSSAFNRATFDEAVYQLAQARARYDRAAAALELTRMDLGDTTIAAPFAGTVSERHAFVGEYLRLGDAVVTVLNASGIEIEAAIPATRLDALPVGARVTFALEDGSTHGAVVRSVVPSEDPLTRTRLVRLTPTDSEQPGAFADNQSLTLLIPIGAARDVITVHKDAVVNGPAGPVVYLAVEGAAQSRPVALGAAIGGRFEVADGLAPGDLVVIRGNERLRPGQAISFEPPES